MKIDFREIELGRSYFEFDAAPGEVDFECSGVQFRQNIIAKASVFSSGDEVVIDADAATSVIAECDRCLKIINLPLKVKLKLVVHRKDGVKDQDTGDDDFIIIPKSFGVYDLKPHFREAFLVELPVKILCNPDCKGLCSNCGTDLNVETCNCAIHGNGGQWDELKKMLKKKIEN
ncbi:MAG: hypothetical protein CO189_02290 [candidate division Zixibacteria bacterium CG_4_9_14_3_um_filter_46_8]|nr:MAG: hypothetical protein CO189_02290 [candidate division Zixibacteria bacterium CG_4_9_14_3_um_filter_46_8]